MNFLKRVLGLSCIFFLLIFFNAQAQSIILRGKVANARTNESLSFVNITINDGKLGTSSDIDGNFYLEIKTEIKKITFSCIGFESFVYAINNKEDLKPFEKSLFIKLYERSKELKEIFITAGENPAHRIIKEASRNRVRNNPEKIRSFSYQNYNKFYLTIEPEKEEIKDSLLIAKTANLDSTDLEMLNFLEKHHLFITESVSERKYIAPDHNKETILASRISGLQNPAITPFTGTFQPIQFYTEHIEILNKAYLNPISMGSTEKYFFAIEDTAYSQKDTVYVISFTPLPAKNFEGLEGILYINTRDFAIQNILVSSLEKDKSQIGFTIEQRYELLEDAYWFPTQTEAYFTFHRFKLGERKYLGIARSYIRNIQIKPNLLRKDFDEISLEIKSEAGNQLENIWDNFRANPLTIKEKSTYQYLDSLGRRSRTDRLLKVVEVLLFGRLKIGKFDLDTRNILRFNRYEGLRLQAGFFTNEQFSELVNLGAYLAYGTKDGNFKFGLSSVFKLLKRFDIKAGFQYNSDVYEPGNFRFMGERPPLSNQVVREFLTERMDKIRDLSIFTSLRPYRNTLLKVGLSKKYIRPAYPYSYAIPNNNGEIFYQTTFNLSELSIQFNYTFGQEYLQIGNRKLFIASKYPIIGFNFIHGSRILGGDFDYQKYEAEVEYSRMFRNIGRSKIRLESAWVNGDAPYTALYNGRGTTRENPVVVDNYFQTMELYEFLSDRLLNIYLTHDFGSLLYKSDSRLFRPELLLAHSMAFGSLKHLERHQGIDFQTMKHGYFESGFLINNILRFNYADLAYWGLGFGVYFRYGSNTKDKFTDNTFLRLSTKFSF